MDVLITAYRSGAAGSNVTTIIQLGATLTLSTYMSLIHWEYSAPSVQLECDVPMEHLRSRAHIAPKTASAQPDVWACATLTVPDANR